MTVGAIQKPLCPLDSLLESTSQTQGNDRGISGRIDFDI